MSTRWQADDLLKLAEKRTAKAIPCDSSHILAPAHTVSRGFTKTPLKPNRYAAFPDFCERMGIPRPIAEHRFHETRLWRIDFYWPESRVALEIEGAIWTNGGHSRGSGRVKDHEKFSEAAALGIRFVFCQPKQVFTAALAAIIKRTLDFNTLSLATAQNTKP